MQEIFGTFIFVLFFKIVTDERLKFSNENAINCLIIAAAYTSSRAIINGTGVCFPINDVAGKACGAAGGISSYGACLNPAIALGICLNSVINWPGDSFKWFWIYTFMPLLGSLLSIIFYRFVYMKTQLMVMNDAEHKEAGELQHEEQQEVQEYDNTMVAAQKTLDE
jgi:glycerol uptake facilitator-like aquaporin